MSSPPTQIPDSPGAQALRRGGAVGRFEQFFFASGPLAHPVYYAGDPQAPPVLLLPEIAGFSPGLILFAERLIDAHFRIFVPWLFGPLGARAPLRNGMRLCVSREFARLRAGVSSPITAWLRALTAHISRHSGGTQVGAIGMCLTGAFAIPLIIDPQVVAAVAAQPSVPLSPLFTALGIGREEKLSQLNVSDGEIAQARTRLEAGQAHLLSVRCRSDRICPRAKIERLRREFPVGLEIREYAEPDDRNRLGERPHATFTKEYRLAPDAPAEHYSRRAFSDLIAFLERHLRTAPKPMAPV
jgi:dienelactone hydrolase